MSNDPLDFSVDLGSRVDTSMPCPSAQQAVATLADVEVKANKAGTGRNMVLKFSLDNAVPALPAANGEARVCNAGYQITEYLPLQQSDNPKAPDFRVKLCRIYDALAKTDDDSRPINLPFGTLIGSKVILLLEPENDPQYGFSARIKKFSALN